MPEHTPAPTPSRSVYGFVLHLLSCTALILYTVWAFLPDSILHAIGLVYLPQKYWAVAIPVYVCVGVALFAFFIYPAMNMMLTPGLDDMKTITDSYALNAKDKSTCRKGIPPVTDISVTDICRQLYMET